jgi:hypothetical protein
VEWAVYRTVDNAVSGAVNRDVNGAVDRANLEDPEHPALKDFLREVL